MPEIYNKLFKLHASVEPLEPDNPDTQWGVFMFNFFQQFRHDWRCFGPRIALHNARVFMGRDFHVE